MTVERHISVGQRSRRRTWLSPHHLLYAVSLIISHTSSQVKSFCFFVRSRKANIPRHSEHRHIHHQAVFLRTCLLCISLYCICIVVDVDPYKCCYLDGTTFTGRTINNLLIDQYIKHNTRCSRKHNSQFLQIRHSSNTFGNSFFPNYS